MAGSGVQALKVPLFDSLGGTERKYLEPRLLSRSFRPGDILLKKGDLADGLYVLTSGLVGVNLGDESESVADVATLGGGECVGEMSLMNGEPCSATIRALTETEVLVIPRSEFPGVVDHCPSLWRNLSAILSRRLVQTNRRLMATPRARFTSLYLLLEPHAAPAMALALGALMARQNGRRVLFLDLTPEQTLVSLVRDSDLASDPAPIGVAGWRLPLPDAADATIAGWQEDGADATTAAERHLLSERFRSEFDDIVFVASSGAGGAGEAWLSLSTATLVVASEDRLHEALDLLSPLAGKAEHRLDLAVVTGLDVTSDNRTGGLWEPAMVRLHARVAARLKSAAPGARLRFLPRDPGLLERVRSHGPAELAPQSDEPFSQALSRLARRLSRSEVGLALGAGMAKGFSHVGVLRLLRREGVPIDYVAGSSIGSIVASTFAGGMALEDLEGLMTGADKRFVKLTLPLKSISSNRGLRKILTTCHERAPSAEFPELFVPFASIATDVTTGEEVVLREDIVWEAVLASISMPGIFPPVELGGRVLVDGGLVNPVPGKTVRDMGADIVIGVDLAAKAGRQPPAGRPRVPNIIEVLWRTMEIMLGEITSRSAASADITIQPETGHSRIRDFSHRGDEFIAAGETAAAEALPQIRALLAAPRVAVAV